METRVQDKWWKALCGVGLLTFFALSFFCDPHSEPDDDWTYSYLIAGRMGPLGTNHYMNPALVGVLKAISRVLPWVNVYEVFRVTLVMAAFAALCLCLFRILQPPCAFAMSALLVFVYWKDTMLTYNFTFTAGLCAAAGALLLCCYATEKMRRSAVAGGICLAVGNSDPAAALRLPFDGGALDAAQTKRGAHCAQALLEATAGLCGGCDGMHSGSCRLWGMVLGTAWLERISAV